MLNTPEFDSSSIDGRYSRTTVDSDPCYSEVVHLIGLIATLIELRESFRKSGPNPPEFGPR